MVVIKWYDDSTPTYADVFETVDYTNDPLVPLMHAPFNSDRKVKRKVLLDKTYTVNRGWLQFGMEQLLSLAPILSWVLASALPTS